MRYCILFILFLSLWACHQNSEEDSMALRDIGGSDDFEMMMDIPVTQQPPPPQANATAMSQPAAEKKIIKTGELAFRVQDSQQAYHNILQQLKKQDAYIENERQSTEYDRKYIRMKIRVASEKFDHLFDSLASQSGEIEERKVEIEDVTERYYDLQARIKNRKALEERYIELLKKAESIKDMLEIERNLNELRMEIEMQEGKFRYLSKQVRYSTIHLHFYELLPYTYSSELRPGFGARLMESLSNGWQIFLSFLIGLTSLWPFLLVLLGVIIGWKKWRRKRLAAGK